MSKIIHDFNTRQIHKVKYYSNFESAPPLNAFSKAVIVVSEETEFSYGKNTGRTMTTESPWANKNTVQELQRGLNTYQHRPFIAEKAILNPAAELGDKAEINGTEYVICSIDTAFGGLCRATISSPGDEEIDHEFPYVQKQQRTVTRRLKQLTAELKIVAGEISAEVVKQEGGDAKSFAWSLKPEAFKLIANGAEVFKVNKSGATIQGKITATSGKIGGFDIKSNRLSYNGQTWNGQLATGIYIGVKGIKLGNSFKVDAAGNLEASSGKFTGTVYAGNIVSGVDQNTGTDYGTMPGSAISAGSLSGTQFSSGVNTILAHAEDAYNVLYKNVRATAIASDQVSAGQILLDGRILGMSTIGYMGSDNKPHALNVVTWAWR